jgi:hypothetical protein
MSWKHAVFVGGALLVLTACSDAVAPQPQLKQTSGRAAAKASAPQTPLTLTVTPDAGECRSGFSVQVGKDCQE